MLIVQSFNKNAIVSTDDSPRGPEGDGEDELGGGMPATTEQDSPMDELYEFLQTYAASQAATAGEEGSPISVTQGDGYIYISFSSAVFFDGDRYNLRPEGAAVLDSLLPALDEAAPFINEIVVSGHTATALGNYDVDFDFRLSTNRAVTVVAYLLENSMALDPARMQPKGYGQWRPVADNEAEADRSKNRRVEMIISGTDLEDNLPDSVEQYYTTVGQEAPEGVRAEYTTAEN